MNSVKFKFERGQSLLELLISFTIVTIVLVAVVSRATDAARSAAFARNEVLAARFAQEGVEWTRAQRDIMGWEAFETLITASGTTVFYCVLDIQTAITALATGTCASGSVITGTIFNRNIRFDHFTGGANEENYVTLRVTVNWSDSAGNHNAEYFSRLSDWQI